MKRILILGVVALVLLTGCLHGGDAVGDGEDRTVAVASGLTDADQAELQELQEEMQQMQMQMQFEAENMTEEEMQEAQEEIQQLQQQLQQQQQEAVQANLEVLREHIQATETVEVVDEGDAAPVFIVSGDAGEILDLLDHEEAAAIVSEEEGLDALQPQQQMPEGEMP